MAGLGYGMYGYNVLNVNGETDSLPACRFNTLTSGSVSQTLYFTEISDNLGMAIPNQAANAGSYSCIRTPISGLYEIEAVVVFRGGAGAGQAQAVLYVDSAATFSSTGLYVVNNTSGAYEATFTNIPITASVDNTAIVKITLFLEKDRYLALYAASVTGTAPTISPAGYGSFSVRCIEAENAGKFGFQT